MRKQIIKRHNSDYTFTIKSHPHTNAWLFAVTYQAIDEKASDREGAFSLTVSARFLRDEVSHSLEQDTIEKCIMTVIEQHADEPALSVGETTLEKWLRDRENKYGPHTATIYQQRDMGLML